MLTVIFCRFPAPCFTKLSRSSCCSENYEPGGFQTRTQSGTMMTATGYSQVMDVGFHTLPQERSSSQFICLTVELPARRTSSILCRRGKWGARCSGTDGAFSSSSSWPEVRQWMLSVTAKHCRNGDRSFRTSGAGCLVPMLSCCTITLGHTRLDGQHIVGLE